MRRSVLRLSRRVLVVNINKFTLRLTRQQIRIPELPQPPHLGLRKIPKGSSGTFLGFTDNKIERIQKTASRRGARVLSFGSGKIQKSEERP